jgi:hypothetical protein
MPTDQVIRKIKGSDIGGSQVSLLPEQPGIEGRRCPWGRTVEQIRSQAGKLDRVFPGPLHQNLDIDHDTGVELEEDGVAVDRTVIAEHTPDLRQAPPQRPKGIVRLREEQ